MDPGYVLFFFIITGCLTLFYYLKTRHLEHMARIEHGLDETDEVQKPNIFRNLGVILSMISLGIISGYLLDGIILVPLPILLISSIFFFSAMGFFIIHRWNR